MDSEGEIYFQSIKQDHGWYFVEYLPPIPGYKFSAVNLMVLDTKIDRVIASAMEKEALIWLSKYPVPFLLTAFDENGVVKVKGSSKDSHITAWRDPTTGEQIVRWGIVPDAELPDIALDRQELKRIYSDFPYTTQEDLRQQTLEQIRANRKIRLVLFAWYIAIPLAWAAIQWASKLLGFLMLLYAIYMAAKKTAQFFGWWAKSDRQKRREAEQLKMQHYRYHCEQNPEGFARLKAENFAREEKQSLMAEVESIRSKDE